MTPLVVPPAAARAGRPGVPRPAEVRAPATRETGGGGCYDGTRPARAHEAAYDPRVRAAGGGDGAAAGHVTRPADRVTPAQCRPRPVSSTSRARATSSSAPQALARSMPRPSSATERAAMPYSTRAAACSYWQGEASR